MQTTPSLPVVPPAEVLVSVPWWRLRRDALLALADAATPHYVYHAPTLRRQAAALHGLGGLARVLYAVKANAHPDVLRVFHAAGLGFECVSPGEVRHVRALFPDLPPEAILFTPNFAPRAEYAWALAEGVRVTLDNLYVLEAWPETLAGHDVFVRVDPGVGRGHHAHVRTAGEGSKFGVAPDEVPALAALAARHGVRVVGLHAHSGSGVGEPDAWAQTAAFLAATARAHFPDARVLDLGGGLDVPTRPDLPGVRLDAVGAALDAVRGATDGFEVWAEPGRFLVAEAGVLLARVTQTKRKGATRYVGVDAGMHVLVRPALYDAYHRVVNLSRLDAPDAGPVEVVGMICETGDVIGHARSLPETHEGDVLVVATTGAYGAAMASRYNLRDPARETVLGGED